MSTQDIKRLEVGVEMLHEIANRGGTLFEAIETLRQAGYTEAELQMALQMYYWNQSKIQ